MITLSNKTQAKRELLKALRNYINHSLAIHRNSMVSNRDTMTGKAWKVRDMLGDLNEYMDLPTICKRIAQQRNALQDILPNPKNNSYASSRDKLSDILTFSALINAGRKISNCKNEICGGHPKIKAPKSKLCEQQGSFAF